MNQGNNQNLNNTQGNVAPAAPASTPVVPTAPVSPAPVQTPVAPANPAPASASPTPVQTPNTNGQVVQPVQTPVSTNQQAATSVEPSQNVIMTGKKKTSVAFIFIAVILVGVFIYFIDDILAYFNQSFSPVIENTEVESGSANLVDGKIKIDDQSSYIKLKYIRFYNVKKSNNNQIFISYLSDKNYNNVSDLGIVIQLFNSENSQIYEEKFSISGSIESGKSRQYKLTVDENVYNNAVYALIKSN